jgi:hypothetical protein
VKNGQNFRELQQQKAKKVDELWIHQPVCMVCKKPTEGYYARYGESGVCGSACMRIQAKVYRFGEHTEEAFLKRIGGNDASTC